jgi:phosphate transport system permease protein
MIIPYATSITTEIIKMVPNDLKEAAYSLGATRRDVILDVIVPNARSGIFTSYVLAFGRALGETMAVTMLIGNANVIPKGIFGSGNTMASVIANQFGEASGLKLSALIAIGLLLFLITGIINGIGKLIIKRFNV